jgi:hypothetical protein
MKSAGDYEREMMDFYRKSTNEGKGEMYKGHLCPTTYKKECRLCDLCKEILMDKKRYPEGDPIRERASTLNRKERYYSNIIFLSNPSEVAVLEYGVKLFNQLIAGQMDPLSQWKFFFDPKNGRNLRLTKTQGAIKKQVEYKIEPNFNPSALPDPSVLKKLVVLTDIVALKNAGKVQTIYQSKIDTNTEFRVLPSWLGVGVTKFFESAIWHFNLSDEDFAACQLGKINPVMNKYEVSSPVTVYTPPTGISTVEIPPGEDLSVLATEYEASILVEKPTELPICFGLYQDNDEKCDQCNFDGECLVQLKQRMEKRQTAKRLSISKK